MIWRSKPSMIDSKSAIEGDANARLVYIWAVIGSNLALLNQRVDSFYWTKAVTSDYHGIRDIKDWSEYKIAE